MQILGSGGPQIKADRASASYLLWVDDKARVLIDMGGGAFLRFGESRAKFTDLAMMGVSHLHPDHISGSQMMLNAGEFGATAADLLGVDILEKWTALGHPPDSNQQVELYASFCLMLHADTSCKMFAI